MKRAVKNLFCDTVTAEPVSFDFSKGYGETWDIALELTIEEHEEFFPMMNYMYPLPNSFERDMEKNFGRLWRSHIKGVLNTTTVIYFYESGEYFLALTGGGMDLSWEICESYINLGYLPPVHFCNLPRLAGKDMTSRRNRRIVRACIRSVKLAGKWAKQREKHLKGLLKEERL